MRTPDEILTDLYAGRPEQDREAISRGLHEALQDICQSFDLAMQQEGIPSTTGRKIIQGIVQDYIMNHYGDD